ncbi:MAG TPA: histidinol-phosphate transaminase [Longimicrobiaceae bacterium]|nr:histidinol-phosphate transaminase [Longimicrobiaceae bacterium]
MRERAQGGEGPESALRHIKSGVRAAGAYTLRHHEPRIKLNQNESPFDLPAGLKERILKQVAQRPWNRYPPFVPERFIGAVTEATGWPAEGILGANGSNELIQAILAVTIAPGVPVVIPEPTFTLYRLLTQVGGGEVVSVPLDAELRFDVEAIIRAARESRAAVIVLCTPNNPTGGTLSREQIERIHDETETLVVLDQAYVEFGGFDATPLLVGRPRLLVLRTFSKAMAMAGLRAGYLLADPALAREIAKGKLPYNLNFFTEIAAAEVLRAREELQAQVAFIVEQRDCILRRLSRLPGLRVFPSEANFVLFRVEAPEITHDRLFERLLSEHGILVRDVSKYPMLEGCLRVTAGTPEETDAFSDAMAAILNEG